MSEPARILYISSEIMPFSPENIVSTVGRLLPQAAHEQGYEIRAFMPRYGSINERRNQLHEVIRLSGMNIIVGDMDRPLTIKVASVPNTRIQVYFIDNEDYFKRRFVFKDENENFFDDNDERSILFTRGTLETVKKLRWQPKIVHCNGWMSHLAPLYLKKEFKSDPNFASCKVIVSLYNEFLKEKFSPSFAKKIATSQSPNIKQQDLALLSNPNGVNLAKLAVAYADGVVLSSKELPKELTDFVAKKNLPQIAFADINANNFEQYSAKQIKFYAKFV